MVFVVPFDRSTLAETALIRATEFNTVMEERVVAVSVIPQGNTEYAREREWIGPDDSFEMGSVIETLHTRVAELAPEADFEHLEVDSYAPSGTIAQQLRQFATDRDTSIVFLGSENAGQIVSGVGEVGPSVAADEAYDVHIVRHPSPSKITRLAKNSSQHHPKPDFYHADTF